MKVLLELAVRNLLGAGLRTWLNVLVLSLTFVVIIASQGIYRGMGDQAAQSMTDVECGGGQYWHSAYDPYDPLSIQDAHGPIPDDLKQLITAGQSTAILIVQGTLYPQGRFLPVLIKGIDPAQTILKLPSHFLLSDKLDPRSNAQAGKDVSDEKSSGDKNNIKYLSELSDLAIDSSPGNKSVSPAVVNLGTSDIESDLDSITTDSAPGIPDEIPAFIGTRMASTARLKPGDKVILRWRDARGAFDARIIRIVQVFRTSVQSVDSGQVWIPLHILQAMARMENEATIITLARETPSPAVDIPGWNFKNLKYLLRDINQLVTSKTMGASIIYLVLLFMSLLAIFDTQVLSIFRRIKEIGTLVALGLTRRQIVLLFTIEGALHAVLAAVLAALYGFPLLSKFARTGWGMPEAFDTYGIALGERLFPVFTAGLIIGTVILIMVLTTIVSFMPARRLSHLKPTDALRGKLQ